MVEPAAQALKGVAAAAIEASDRVQANSHHTVGLFGLLKMLKDPNVQRSLSFAQSFLHVLNEKKHTSCKENGG